jgi:peptide/nickel transport system substrate-binding protein
MRKRSILLAAGALALVASLMIGPTASAKSSRSSAGTVVVGEDQEPDILNPYLTAGNSQTTADTMNLVLAGGTIFNQSAALTPYLLTANPKLLKTDPLTATMTYKPNAVWSDGKPITGADFVATWKTELNPNYDITSRDGWDTIQSVKAKGKTVVVTWQKGKPYASWDALMGTSPMPAHVIAGQDFNHIWDNSISVSSGPFMFKSWQKGTQLTLVKNPTYKATPGSKISNLVFRYIPSTPSIFQALQAGEVQVMYPQPQLQIVDIRKNPKFKVAQSVGYSWAHLDIQVGPKGNPALKKAYVRQALVQGMNRAQIRQALYVTPGLVASVKDLPVLQSNIYKPFEKYYQPNWGIWKFSQRNVIALLKKNGCTGGPDKPDANNSAIWSCPGVGKLSFRFTTTSGNQLRALTFEIIQKQLKSVGIELLPRFGPSATVFGQILPSGDWDLFMFNWSSSPTNTATSWVQYGCGGDQNYMNSCNNKANAMYKKAEITPDPAARAKLLNGAEAIMARQVDSIPMFIAPLYLINNKNVSGPILNPTQQGFTWNAETWKTVG